MGFIRKMAVRMYSKELIRMVDVLSQASPEKVARFLTLSVWIRALLEVEGNIKLPVGENGDELNPELHCYPFMLKELKKWVSIFNKEGLGVKSMVLSIWVLTLRSIFRPELKDLANKMWAILMSSKPGWEKYLVEYREEDIELGISHDLVLKTERHAKAILKCLPPKQLS